MALQCILSRINARCYKWSIHGIKLWFIGLFLLGRCVGRLQDQLSTKNAIRVSLSASVKTERVSNEIIIKYEFSRYNKAVLQSTWHIKGKNLIKKKLFRIMFMTGQCTPSIKICIFLVYFSSLKKIIFKKETYKRSSIISNITTQQFHTH